jgi:hypothetical protein
VSRAIGNIALPVGRSVHETVTLHRSDRLYRWWMKRALLWLAVTGCWTRTAPDPLPAPPGSPPARLPDGPYATHALQGPYASKAAWCEDLVKRARDAFVREIGSPPDDEDAPRGCLSHRELVTRGPTRLGPGGRAITAVELAPYGNEQTWGPSCALVLTTARGLYAAEDALHCRPPPGESSIVSEIAIEELAWVDLVGSRPGEALGNELVVKVTEVRAFPAVPGGKELTTKMIVCGAGASGVPRCTTSIPIRRHVDGLHDVDYKPTVDDTGILHFAVEDRGDTMDPDQLAQFERKHPLRFP